MPSVANDAPIIAHILPWPAVGGTEHATLRIARAVRERGFRSVIFCLRQAIGVRELFVGHGFETVAFDSTQASMLHPLPYLRHLRRMRRELKVRGVSLLHCADVMGAFYAAPAAKLAGIPVLCHVRNQFDALSHRERILLSAVDKFAFVSTDTWRRFSYPVDSGHGLVLYDGIAVRHSRDAEASRAVRRELRLSPTTPLVGMIARVSPQKDYFTLARAAAQVVKKVRDVRFVVVGDIAEEAAHRAHYTKVAQELARLGLTNAFIFTGFRSDVARMMSSFDVAVLSTNWEGLPLVVLESMALGIPTVATSVNGIPEIIPRSDLGRLVPPGDDAALADQLIFLLTDKAAAEKMGASGRSFVEAAFSTEAFAANVTRVYDEMLASR